MRTMEKLKINYEGKDGNPQEQICELGMFNTVKLGIATVPIPEAGFWFKAFHPEIKNIKTQIVQVN